VLIPVDSSKADLRSFLFCTTIRAICALVYLTFGVLCFDRFTSKAFLSTKNPLVTTAIPQPNNNQSDYSQPTPVYPQGNENEDLDYSVEDSRGDDMT